MPKFQTPIQHQTGAQSPQRGSQYTLPIRHDFRYLDRIAWMTQEQALYGFGGVIEKQIYQTPDYPNSTSENQMEGLLAETQLLPNMQRFLPMASEILTQISQEL